MPMERAASWRGSTSMRTAYFCEPNTSTCATPVTIEMRWAMVCCPYSSRTESGTVFDERTRMMTDWSLGFAF